MKKLKNFVILTIVSLVLIISITIAWIWNISYNRSGEIASAILFGRNSIDDEKLNDQIISSALFARFPPGSSPEKLTKMISTLGGKCESKKVGSIDCRLPRSAIPCMNSWLEFAIDVSPEGMITNIKADSKELAC